MKMDIMKEIQKRGQPYTAQTLYNTMHVSHIGYRHKNQGLAVVCDWLHLLRDKRGVVHDPWTDKPMTIIEVGCGNGKLCDFLRSLGFQVAGMDIFDNKVVYDRSWYCFAKHDLAEVPYPFDDKKFDYCLCFDVLEHLKEEHVAPALQEMARISNDGIIIKVSCSGEPPLHLTVKTPGWWLEQLTENCPDYSWQLLRNFERIAKEDGPMMRSQKTFSDVRPLPDGYVQTFAPLFFGKRGAIADEG